MQPTAADRAALTPAEREELRQFARERFPRFYSAVLQDRRPMSRLATEMWLRLKVLRRVSLADPAIGDLLANLIRQEDRIRAYGRVISLLPEESNAGPLLRAELREAVAGLLKLEHELLAARTRFARLNAERFITNYAAALLAGERPPPPVESIRGILDEARAQQDENAEALRARLVAELKSWIEQFLDRAEAELARREPASPDEVEARTQQLLKRIERTQAIRERSWDPQPDESQLPPTDAPLPE